MSTDKINLNDKLSLFDTHWDPKVVATYNSNDVMVVKFQGEFDFHKHDDSELGHPSGLLCGKWESIGWSWAQSGRVPDVLRWFIGKGRRNNEISDLVGALDFTHPGLGQEAV